MSEDDNQKANAERAMEKRDQKAKEPSRPPAGQTSREGMRLVERDKPITLDEKTAD